MMHPYSVHEYAESLPHLGRAFPIAEWDTSVLVRDIEGGMQDVTGPYPLTILPKSADIAGGLERLRREGFVSLVLVLDDFHRPELEVLKQHFTRVKPFKTHYVYRTGPEGPQYDSHHRYELRQAHKHVRSAPLDWKRDAEGWQRLYSTLAARRNVSPAHQFPAEHHAFLAQAEGVTSVGAWVGDELVSAHIWVSDGRFVHSHLAASSEAGYKYNAAYAVNDASLRLFKDAELINLGGGAGVSDNKEDGLARFKKGFSNGTASSYICGVILDNKRYDQLAIQAGVGETDFFPAYRGKAK